MAVIGLARRALKAGHGLARKGALVAMVVVLGACAAVYHDHGYVPSEADLATVEVGVDTQDTVGQKLGRPSAAGVLAGDGWYYVQSRFKHFGPREPKEIDRQVVAVTFDAAGKVENIARYGLADGQVIEISRRVTSTNIKGISLIKQLLGNFGRISAEDMLR